MAASARRDPHAELRALEADLERLKEENARLRESERMYRFSAEAGGRLVWCTDPEGRLLSLSRMFSQLSGFPEAKVIEEGWLTAVHADDRERVAEQWRRCLASGEPFAQEFRALLRDGSDRLVLSRAAPSRDKEGRILRWYGSTEDVQSERDAARGRIEAEERLRESEERYRHTLELSRQIVWTAGPDGEVDYLSPRFAELTGLPPGSRPRLSIHPDDVGHVVDRWSVAVESGGMHSVEYRLRTADGDYRLVRARAAPRRDEAGQVVRWYGTIEDIQAQREADMARRVAEERYRLAAKATDDAIWDYDVIAGTVEWSEGSAGILGAAKMSGVTSLSAWEERVHPEDRLRVSASLADALAGGGSRWSETYRFRRDDGSYVDVLDRGFFIRAPDGTAIRAVGAMADLTERQRAEAEIRRMQAELVHVSRVSAMGTMASTLAHELNQPLTAVTNYVRTARRVLARGEAVDPMVAEALEAAESGALRAGQIVRRLRELVSRGTVSVVVEHLPKLIEEAGVVGFVDEASLGVEHRLELDPAAQWVRADRIQIQQVLINLIRNAVEAMADSPRREILIATRALDEMVEISVADTGCGLPDGETDSLFSHFMTTKHGGMGIGLPISRTIVEAHGGRIRAERREGGGAIFTFTLPRGRPRGENG